MILLYKIIILYVLLLWISINNKLSYLLILIIIWVIYIILGILMNDP